MRIKELEKSEIQLAMPAEIGLYALQDKDIKGIIRTVKSAKDKIDDKKTLLNGSFYSSVYQLSYKNFIILLRIHQNSIEIIDILNKAIYNPNNNFHPELL
jgi:hypothetical protein